MDRTRSQNIFEHLCERMPGGVSSGVRAARHVNYPPIVVERGEGAHLIDCDGHRYLDYCCSWGALIHGHAHPKVIGPVMERMRLGTTFGMTTALEGELAALISRAMPSIERVRFVASGTEATMTAVRLARGFTQKSLVLRFEGSYHGHADSVLTHSNPKDGLAYLGGRGQVVLPYNDEAALTEFFASPQSNDLAAVLVEPIAGNIGVVPPAPSFLRRLREETRRVAALLIFDEVITGFRVALGGAQQWGGVVPDLTCLGKIMGGGFPAAAVGGKREILEHLSPIGPVVHGGTLSGNPVAMEGGRSALSMLFEPGFYERLEQKSARLVESMQRTAQRAAVPIVIHRVGSMWTPFFGQERIENSADVAKIDRHAYAALYRFFFERGVFIPPSPFEAWFLSSVHSDEELDRTAALWEEFVATLG